MVYSLVDLLAVCCSFEKLPRVAIGEYRAKGKVTNRVPSLRVSTPLLLHRQTDFHGKSDSQTELIQGRFNKPTAAASLIEGPGIAFATNETNLIYDLFSYCYLLMSAVGRLQVEGDQGSRVGQLAGGKGGRSGTKIPSNRGKWSRISNAGE